MVEAARFLLGFLLLLSLSTFALSIYEDQAGLADWHGRYIGEVKHAVFHAQKAGRRRVVVSTEQNAIASLDLRTGDIFWRHVLGKDDAVNQLSLSLGKYVVTLSSQGNLLRTWNLPDGQMIWETDLQISNPADDPFIHILGNVKSGRDSLILACNGGSIRAVSSIDGLVVWRKDLSVDGLKLKHVFQPPESDTIYAVGFIHSSQIAFYHINAKTGELLKHAAQPSPAGLSTKTSAMSGDSIVVLDSTKSNLLLFKFTAGIITHHHKPLSDIVEGFSGTAELIPTKSSDIFVVKTPSNVVFIKVRGDYELELVGKADQAGIVSDSLTLSEEEQAFAVVHHSNNAVNFQVKINGGEALTEVIQMEEHRGHVNRVFLNNYLRTDKSHGFRALLVMEDESLLLVQQGEVVWKREDGLASISDAVPAELPVEKEGVSVVEVEHTLLEWLKGHLLKLKGTLMLATPDDMAAIQAMHLKSAGRNKMTRDHNGFRKLIIVLTQSGKIYALHTGDGRIVWAYLLNPPLQSRGCLSPSALTLRNWRVPHHKALQENPSVLLVGRCGANLESQGFLSIVDSYSGKELETMILDHSISEVVPLPLTDSSEQKLHLIIDNDLNAHLYPRGLDSLKVFMHEMANMYYYKVENAKGVIKGYAFVKGCGASSSDEYCFSTRELWSLVFPSESERIVATARRKLSEVVHTQAKIMTNQDVMYKYISKNILFVATVSPKAGGIGSSAPDEASLVAYLIDTVTGRILHRVTHQGAQGPVHAVVSENWVVYHYFNLRAHRFEMTVIEIYDQSRADNKDVMKLVLGKHNLTAPITSYSRPEITTKSQSYFFTHSIKAIAVTTTARGITSKQLLIGTIGDQVLALDKRFLDPRRTANPSQEEKEEGIIPLTDTLPIIPQSYVTHTLQVGDLRGIVSFPAILESTTHVFSYGIDLFYTRIAPSRTFDSLTDEFSYALLLLTVVVLIVAILVTWVMSNKKDLQEKWR